MHRAGLKGVAGRPKWTRIKPDTIAKDLVKRDFASQGPNELWATGITGQLTCTTRGRRRSTPWSC